MEEGEREREGRIGESKNIAKIAMKTRYILFTYFESLGIGSSALCMLGKVSYFQVLPILKVLGQQETQMNSSI